MDSRAAPEVWTVSVARGSPSWRNSPAVQLSNRNVGGPAAAAVLPRSHGRALPDRDQGRQSETGFEVPGDELAGGGTPRPRFADGWATVPERCRSPRGRARRWCAGRAGPRIDEDPLGPRQLPRRPRARPGPRRPVVRFSEPGTGELRVSVARWGILEARAGEDPRLRESRPVSASHHQARRHQGARPQGSPEGPPRPSTPTSRSAELEDGAFRGHTTDSTWVSLSAIKADRRTLDADQLTIESLRGGRLCDLPQPGSAYCCYRGTRRAVHPVDRCADPQRIGLERELDAARAPGPTHRPASPLPPFSFVPLTVVAAPGGGRAVRPRERGHHQRTATAAGSAERRV